MKTVLYPLLLLCLFAITPQSYACDTDFDCGMGAVCIKRFGAGQCFRSVDRHGNPKDNTSPNDFINKYYQMKKGYYCNSDRDCPRGSYCDSQYNICIRY